jgi:hypothetical protein
VSDLIDCQRTVERMLTESRTLAEVEEYVEHCALDEMEKAGLWMLAWAHQDQATQLRLAKETLALVSSMRSSTKSGRKGAPPRRPPGKGGYPPRGSSDKASRHRDSHRDRSPTV